MLDTLMQEERPDWQSWFMSLASLVALRSPDPSTKHGAIIADSFNRVLGVGYNGFPRGGDDSVYPRTRPEKYLYIVHAEPNAVSNCVVRPEGATIYVTGRPCPQCMACMVQAGIKKIVYGQIGSTCVDEATWNASNLIATTHGIELMEYEGKNPRAIISQLLEYLQSKNWH